MTKTIKMLYLILGMNVFSVLYGVVLGFIKNDFTWILIGINSTVALGTAFFIYDLSKHKKTSTS